MPRIFKENKLLLPSLIVLVAAVIMLIAALIVAGASSKPAMAQQVPLDPNFVPASTSSPAHFKTPAGEANPADSLPHYANYNPRPFHITAVGQASITGTFLNASTTEVLSVTSATNIYRQGAQKDAATIQKELADFRNKLRYADTYDVYNAPDPFVHIPIKLSDIAPGADAIVSAPDGEHADLIFIPQE